MNTPLRAALGCGTAALALILGATPAFAAPSPSPLPVRLDAAKQVVTARIDGRLATLRALSTAVDAATHLTPAHKNTISTLIGQDQSGLSSLRTKVAGETTLAGVKADDQSMVDDYRIYLLVAPKVRLTISADLETTAVGQLDTAADTLAAAIASARAAGKDTTRAEADLADMKAQTAAASTAIAGKADTVLAIAPGPDGQAIQNQVSEVRDAVRSARTDLRKALADAKAVKADLGGTP